MTELLVLALIGLGTYAMRAAFLVTAQRRPPAAVARLLPYVGPAVLAALVAAAVAWLAWRLLRRNLPIALFGGLAAWWAASWAVTAVQATS